MKVVWGGGNSQQVRFGESGCESYLQPIDQSAVQQLKTVGSGVRAVQADVAEGLMAKRVYEGVCWRSAAA